MKLPVAEIFTSPQGEGAWAGKLMTFIRMAGCSVGEYRSGSAKPATCTSYAGEFECDTDYRRKFSVTADEALAAVKSDTICLTGGEPADHDLTELIEKAHTKRLRVHLETSGTVWQDWLTKVSWIACSPKKTPLNTVLARVHELRFLYDPSWKGVEEKIQEIANLAVMSCDALGRQFPRVYVSPVNGYHNVNRDNIKATLDLIERHPEWMLSLQLHKMIGVR